MLTANIVYNILCGLQFMCAIKTVVMISFLIIYHKECDSNTMGTFMGEIVKYLIYAASITVTLYLF